MGIIKENNIEVPKDIIPALVALAKDKELVITICKEILANIPKKLFWVQRIKPLVIVLLLNTLRIKAVISLFTITKDINLLEWLRK